MAGEPVFLYLATYSAEADAQADYETLKQEHRDHLIGTYDVAVVSKDAEGKVTVHKHEKPTQYGAWTGLAVGAAVGLLFPPMLVVDAAFGAAAGSLVAHLSSGMSRADVKVLGDLVDEHEAAIVIVGKTRVPDQAVAALTRARKHWEKAIAVDQKDFEQELAAAIKDLKE